MVEQQKLQSCFLFVEPPVPESIASWCKKIPHTADHLFTKYGVFSVSVLASLQFWNKLAPPPLPDIVYPLPYAVMTVRILLYSI